MGRAAGVARRGQGLPCARHGRFQQTPCETQLCPSATQVVPLGECILKRAKKCHTGRGGGNKRCEKQPCEHQGQERRERGASVTSAEISLKQRFPWSRDSPAAHGRFGRDHGGPGISLHPVEETMVQADLKTEAWHQSLYVRHLLPTFKQVSWWSEKFHFKPSDFPEFSVCSEASCICTLLGW